MSPPTPRLFVRDEARADVAEAFRWYEERHPGLGYEFTRAVRVLLATVERAPQQYPVALDIRRFPYVVYYVVLPDAISVIAVTHGSRHPRRWQSRR